MAIGHGSGKDKAIQAANAVISSPLLETSIAGAKRLLINVAMSEDTLASDVDTASKMITDAAAPDVQFIFGAAFKEDMQDEMTITVIAADFDTNEKKVSAVEEDEEDDVIPIDNPMLDDFDFGHTPSKTSPSDMSMDEIFEILGGK